MRQNEIPAELAVDNTLAVIKINQATSRHNLDENLEIVLDGHEQVLTVAVQKERRVVVAVPRIKTDRLIESPITRGGTRYGSYYAAESVQTNLQ